MIPELQSLVHGTRERHGQLSSWKRAARDLWPRQTLVVLYGPATSAAAIDLESKFTEAALGNLQIANYRNFAHGRHHWLAKHGSTSGVIAFTSEGDRVLATKTLSLLPEEIPVARLDFDGDFLQVSLAALLTALHIAGWAGEERRIDPGRPGVPSFGRRLFRLAVPRQKVSRKTTISESDAAAIERKTGASTTRLEQQCEPANDTPIIVQEIRRSVNGHPTHRFRWACPHCGHWLPRYRAVTLRGAADVRPHLNRARLFFMDRVSPAALDLASEAAARGAVVVFEPSSRTDDRLLDVALGIAHIVKYADHRLALRASTRPGPSVLLQIETMGTRGLRYRSWLPQAKTQRWEHLDSVKAPFVADTCGAGDWCSAGILASLATEGHEGLTKRSASQLELALRYGQTLAAWNCGFEGARGGMYAVDRVSFEKQVRRIGKGAQANTFKHPTASQESPAVVPCPACRVAS